MGFLRVDTLQLFPDVRGRLLELLDELDEAEWSAPTVCQPWRVRDVVAHLVGVELANVSRRRDQTLVKPPQGMPLPTWLERFNADWVNVSERLSPRVMRDLVEVAGAWFDEYLHTLDLDAMGGPVSWAGSRPAPVWLDVAREYTERWVHQQQIREATQRPGLMDPEYLGPVLRAFVHALPRTFEGVDARDGSGVEIAVEGEELGQWHLVAERGAWDLREGALPSAAARVTLTPVGAWRLFTRHPETPAPVVEGDARLGGVVAESVAIIR